MAYEIDFLPVGDGEKSGDAIAMRFGNLCANPPQQTVVVIDGGTKESGTALVEHIKTSYNTNSVYAVVCTHSDADHASGLTEVLENCNVERLYMHLPWNHVADLDKLFSNEAVTTDSLKRHFKKSLDNAHELESLAKKKGITIFEPFSDTIPSSDYFTVLSPSTKFYEDLLQSFRCVPESIAKPPEFVRKAVETVKDALAKWVEERWDFETLAEPKADDCSAENNSSVILLFKDGDAKFLFTSDAGVPALTDAVSCATRLGIDLKSVEAMQVPHHGSKHNVGPQILDRIVGPRLKEQQFSKTAVVSASKGSEKHPSRRVVNALKRRGAEVFTTKNGSYLRRSTDAPQRSSWAQATPLPFYNRVEEE